MVGLLGPKRKKGNDLLKLYNFSSNNTLCFQNVTQYVCHAKNFHSVLVRWKLPEPPRHAYTILYEGMSYTSLQYTCEILFVSPKSISTACPSTAYSSRDVKTTVPTLVMCGAELPLSYTFHRLVL